MMFPWSYGRRPLWDQFGDIQRAAGLHLLCNSDHEHTEACCVYGFHDLRRAFATMNANKFAAEAIQTLMRHKSYATTQKYINMSNQLDNAG